MIRWLIVLLLFVGVAHSQPVDKNDPGYIQVMGIGKTVDEAKRNGFKNAISMKVGSALLSENQLTNNKLVKEDIVDYSAGYIDTFTIIDTIIKPDSVVVIMQVVVKSSKIHERILNKGKDEKELDGARLSNQYLSYLTERKSGDNFLSAVLNDYPARAFNITQGAHEFKLNTQRNAVLVIPFEMRWSKPFLVSLHESLKLLSDGSYNAPSSIVVGHSSYKFNDYGKYALIKQQMNGGLQLQAVMINRSDQAIATRCFMIPPVFSGSYSSSTYVVDSREVIKSVIQIEIDAEMTTALSNAARVELSAVTTCSNSTKPFRE